jgi:flagellar secretion chaperone FliS
MVKRAHEGPPDNGEATMYNRAANRYRNVSLQSASPQQMLGEVFHRLLKDIADASQCIEAKNVVGKSKAVNHAIDLIAALVSSLDFESAPDLCANLERLYGFVQDRLLAASAQMQVAPLQEAERVLMSLRDAFVEAAGQP